MNIIETMAFDKSGWKIIEESADGSTIYFGKPMTSDVELSDKVWTIKRTTIEVSDDGTTTTTTKYAAGAANKWTEKESLTYTF